MILSVGNQSGAVKRRLVDMGLTPGTTVKVTKVAPLGDPWRSPSGAMSCLCERMTPPRSALARPAVPPPGRPPPTAPIRSGPASSFRTTSTSWSSTSAPMTTAPTTAAPCALPWRATPTAARPPCSMPSRAPINMWATGPG
ncbi:MAG: FeoA family protein [Oscillospiraceae bacterium]